jgi:DNA repair protein RadD
MTEINSKIYKAIKGKVSSQHIEKILGGALYRGLTNYQQYMGHQSFDLAELLLKCLGTEALFTPKFQAFLCHNVLTDSQINGMAVNFGIVAANPFTSRELLLAQSRGKVALALAAAIGLDKSELIEPVERPTDSDPIFINPDPERFLSLHDYQKTIKDSIVKNLLEDPSSRMLVHMPTGSGKTKTCVEAIVDFLRTRPFNEGIVVWFAHSNELCSQAYESMVETWKFKGDYPLPIFRIFGEHDPINEILSCQKAVVFVGFQKFRSLQTSTKERSVQIRTHLSTNTQLVVIDEAHKSLATTYKGAVDYISLMPNCRLIGLTATPGRSNNMNDPSNSILADYFKANLITITDDENKRVRDPLSYLQGKAVLATIDHKPIEVNIDEFSDAELNAIAQSGELDQNHIDRIVESAVRNKIVVDEIDNALKDVEKDLVLVFAASTAHCVLLQKLLEFQGIRSAVVLATTTTRLRDKYISDFKQGKLRVLINFGVLTTGFDAPRLKTLIIARHTNSMILYSQMIGRALRGPLNGGNPRNYIVDLVDNVSSLGSPAFLFTYWEDFWGKKFKSSIN